jgi:hypothetical protein
MTRDNKHLRIVYNTDGHTDDRDHQHHARQTAIYPLILSNLAIAESNLVKAGKDSALPHFIAIVKELEQYYGFKFEVIEDA